MPLKVGSRVPGISEIVGVKKQLFSEDHSRKKIGSSLQHDAKQYFSLFLNTHGIYSVSYSHQATCTNFTWVSKCMRPIGAILVCEKAGCWNSYLLGQLFLLLWRDTPLVQLSRGWDLNWELLSKFPGLAFAMSNARRSADGIDFALMITRYSPQPFRNSQATSSQWYRPEVWSSDVATTEYNAGMRCTQKI